MKLRIVHLLLLQSVMLLLSCSNQSRKNMDTSAEPADVQANVSDSSRIEQEAISMIEDFYEAYAASFMSTGKEALALGDSIKQKFLTKELIEKVDRLIEVTDADPIIRAQDLGENDMKTLSVKHQNDNWYEVNYTSAKGSQFERAVSIPVRVVNVDGQYQIDDITPEN